jgi:hypothetical protein
MSDPFKKEMSVIDDDDDDDDDVCKCSSRIRMGSMYNHYDRTDGAPVSAILKNILGPLCDENRDAYHQLERKIQAMHAGDPAKKEMKVEVLKSRKDESTWITLISIIKYMDTSGCSNYQTMQFTLVDGLDIRFIPVMLQEVYTFFFILYQ